MSSTTTARREADVPANVPDPDFDWRRIAYLVHVSRALDALEEGELVPAKKVLYQFSARGHDMAQAILGSRLDDPKDAVCGYYRSRPLVLALGVDPADALGSNMMRAGGYSGGRDIGAVFNFPNPHGPSALPMCGGVGAQYTPTAGWAQAVHYHETVLKDPAWSRAVGVVLGGDASVATNGFWSALTMATTLKLPMLFYIEDNGFGISVPGTLQTPGADIAANLESFKGLEVLSGDGTDPAQAARLVKRALAHVRGRRGPCLLRLTVPRLQGHSAQDTQAYKPAELVAAERARDPLPKLREHLVPAVLDPAEWDAIAAEANAAVEDALARGLGSSRPRPGHGGCGSSSPTTSRSRTWAGSGLRATSRRPRPRRPRPRASASTWAPPSGGPSSTSCRVNPKVVLFGEDVGPKGGVHGVTLGLQDKFGPERVFDTSLSEEGIVGRAVGMALAGLMPCPEIQFRKYADPAAEQINDCGTMRWRTRNRFAAPMVLRMPVGFLRCGDPWHSQTDEVRFVHAPGWKVAVPSNAADAVGLLRAALRGNDPVVFLEHRALLDAPSARRPYPGDDYVLPFGRARITREGSDLTIVTWGAMLERCEAAAEASRPIGRGDRPAHPHALGQARGARIRCGAPAAAWSCTRTSARPASGRRSSRWWPGRPSSTSTRRRAA